MMSRSLKVLFAAALLSVSGLAAASVNVNAADVRALDKELVGVGKTTATKMVDERAKGEFKDMKDLQKRVRGFGAKLAAKNQDKIRFKD